MPCRWVRRSSYSRRAPANRRAVVVAGCFSSSPSCGQPLTGWRVSVDLLFVSLVFLCCLLIEDISERINTLVDYGYATLVIIGRCGVDHHHTSIKITTGLQHVCGPNIHNMCKFFGTISSIEVLLL